MKKISVVIPTYNEEENICGMIDAVKNLFAEKLADYDFDIIVIDNDSADSTRALIRTECNKDERVKAIFNERNYGWLRSPIYGLLSSDGDCAISIAADFQDPVELIPEFVKAWENGSKVVVGQKTNSSEKKLMWSFRSLYYKLVKKFSDVEQLEHFTGFGLYDKSFIDILRELNDPIPFMKGYVAEFCGHPEVIKYHQPKRQKGKSWGSFLRLYDVAMVGITGYTKIGIRAAVFLGLFTSFVSFIMAIGYLVYKLTHWYYFDAGIAPLVVGVFFIFGVQMFFLGMMGEYILSINERIRHRPLVVEKERINFDTDNND